MENINEELKEGRKALSCLFRGLAIIAITLLIIMISTETCKGQQWKYQNKGLYPNSLGLTINPKNHALGIRYSYLFQEPVLSIPLGIYGSYSHSILPNKWYNNYIWEEKYSIGLIFALPAQKELNNIHNFITIAPVYNRHPREWQNEGLPPGMYYPQYYVTTPIGLDIGTIIQINHSIVHMEFDVINWFQYAVVGYSIAFSFHKSY